MAKIGSTCVNYKHRSMITILTWWYLHSFFGVVFFHDNFFLSPCYLAACLFHIYIKYVFATMSTACVYMCASVLCVFFSLCLFSIYDVRALESCCCPITIAMLCASEQKKNYEVIIFCRCIHTCCTCWWSHISF